MADTSDLKSAAFIGVPVQVRSGPPTTHLPPHLTKRKDAWLLGQTGLCGCNIKANVPVFQTGDEGSIPFTRSREFYLPISPFCVFCFCCSFVTPFKFESHTANRNL